MVRFDKPCCNTRDALNYFAEHMAKSDYLTEGGAVEMVWCGQGAQRLGLSGKVDARHFESLCKGHHPFTNEKLMLRDDGASRRVCYFGQISAPKDVSIALYVGGDERIARWWKEAMDETLREIELATLTRVAGVEQSLTGKPETWCRPLSRTTPAAISIRSCTPMCVS